MCPPDASRSFPSLSHSKCLIPICSPFGLPPLPFLILTSKYISFVFLHIYFTYIFRIISYNLHNIISKLCMPESHIFSPLSLFLLNCSVPTPGDLKSHMYIHNGSWPLKCPICNRGFSKQTNLRNHIFLHSKWPAADGAANAEESDADSQRFAVISSERPFDVMVL